MPTYEYVCTQCDDSLEIYQSFTDAPLEKCELCAGKLRRVYHPVAVVFKGSGFYSNDARAGRQAAKRRADKESGKTAESANGQPKRDSGGGESKPAAKKEGSPAPKKVETA